MEIKAELVKSERTQRSWTQQHLADACDVSLRTIQRVERYGNASNETVMALSAVLEIPQQDLILPDTPVVPLTIAASENEKGNEKIIQFIVTLCSGMVIGAAMVAVLVK